MFEALLTAAMFLARFEPATPAADEAPAEAAVPAPETVEKWGQAQAMPCEDLEATDWSCPRDFSPRVRGSDNRKPRQENGTFG